MRDCERCKRGMIELAGYSSPLCPPCRLEAALLAQIEPGNTVIDCGCGMGAYIPAVYSRVREQGALVLLDAHAEYLARVVAPAPIVKVQGILPEVLSLFQDNLFDVAISCDVPEHLMPLDAMRLITGMRRIAKKVLLFVPEGEHPQDKDHYELGADHWQTHRSTWTLSNPGDDPLSDVFLRASDELSVCHIAGFDSYSWPDFHALNPVEGRSNGAIFCVSTDRLFHHQV